MTEQCSRERHLINAHTRRDAGATTVEFVLPPARGRQFFCVFWLSALRVNGDSTLEPEICERVCAKVCHQVWPQFETGEVQYGPYTPLMPQNGKNQQSY
ncbi:hypothetical protein B9Z55_023315 [Caenorhabditis nigoni]|uniref:Uncharacterized protein n=1 Tax=Caenorhabditis nigoni TaxID=1611254 RepID=A0A2G5SP12_9PELO|nr:hypothetical protein B9Z55_023315 [Caenorhabditis nigoni]